MIKGILYLIVFPISIWALDSINFANAFKKNKYYQARTLYFILSASLSYLTVNFLVDLFQNFKIL